MIRAGRLGLIALCAASLSGCVVAAIPVLAGGALAGTTVRGSDEDAVRPPVETAASAPMPTAPSAAPTSVTPVPSIASTSAPRIAIESTAPQPSVATPYDAFVDYALAEARAYLPTETRKSTVLADPDALSLETRACENQAPAVMIDLDPQGDTLDPSAVRSIAVELAPALARLRAKGLTIVWLSGGDRNNTPAIRDLLGRSMLDPTGRDVLALPGESERKQGVRRRLGEEFCIEAIAGDRRADFDELYDFLRDESAAYALEPLIGEGWFLVPPVLGAADKER